MSGPKKRPEDLNPICGAKTRGARGGRPCKRSAVNGGDRCRTHGGGSPRGVAHPNASQNGMYSKYMRPALRKTYDTIASDQGRATMQHDIVLTKTFIAEALQRMGDGANATSQTLGAVQKAYDDLTAYQRARDEKQARLAFVRLGQHIERAVEERDARDEVVKLSDHHRKLTESELKLVLASRTMMTTEEANGIVQALQDAVFQTVTDHDTRMQIAVRFATILNLPRAEASSA